MKSISCEPVTQEEKEEKEEDENDESLWYGNSFLENFNYWLNRKLEKHFLSFWVLESGQNDKKHYTTDRILPLQFIPATKP